jgi:hypothetical protein
MDINNIQKDVYLKRKNKRRWIITSLSSTTWNTHIVTYQTFICDMIQIFLEIVSTITGSAATDIQTLEAPVWEKMS